ncbi:MAG TPA: YraN family protein [Candidatus Paceibacterota bacterium]|nr:YraN family protein [Candidatus Paceibacterota bacterium]
MARNKTSIGCALETQACLYLTKNGYDIIDRNFRMPFGEIDIIAKDRQAQELVFVEVKGMTINSDLDKNNRAKPEDHFTATKIQRLKKIIMAYLNNKNHAGIRYYDTPWRVDLIAIESSPAGTILNLNHYKNLYIPFG